ncbi:unnamed protein product [Acanthosepion pharaonis]|uniref:Uncharacterized protein n=1 Tax=Acanthosepion pharaonis TaxID=158019 RepID=A0A812BGJ3_ACAPH|nr:unnamed protein product [Sepia pharaonis]
MTESSPLISLSAFISLASLLIVPSFCIHCFCPLFSPYPLSASIYLHSLHRSSTHFCIHLFTLSSHRGPSFLSISFPSFFSPIPLFLYLFLFPVISHCPLLAPVSFPSRPSVLSFGTCFFSIFSRIALFLHPFFFYLFFSYPLHAPISFPSLLAVPSFYTHLFLLSSHPTLFLCPFYILPLHPFSLNYKEDKRTLHHKQ